MKATFAPLTFKKETPVQSYSRESVYDSTLQAKYDYFKKKGLPITIPPHTSKKVAYTRANELPFVEFEPSNAYMSKFLVADDSGDRKDEKKGLTFEEKRARYLNLITSAKLRLQISLMNQEYLTWKTVYYSPSGPNIRWTGEVSYYGSYIFFTIALRFTPEFFHAIFFKSGLYQTKGGRFLIMQFLEQILNLRFVKGLYDKLEKLGPISVAQLEENLDYQSLLTDIKPGFTTLFPMLQGTLAIAQSFLSDKNISFQQLFMKNLPNLLATPTINYVAATFAVNLFGLQVPVMVSQLAASVFVQFLSGKVTELTQVYFFADLIEDEKRQNEALARKEIELERERELEARRKYVEVGIVGKDIDDRIKMKFDWEGNFGKNIAKFQDGLYTAWKTRGKALPIFGSVGFNALLGVWGFSTISGFLMFMTTNDFEGYQFATGKNINYRFFFDFLTGMLRSFRFFDNMFSIETLAFPVVQKLRNDLIRIFTELATGIFSDMKSFVANSKLKAYFTGEAYDTISRLQKQSAFAYYFFTAMEKILETLNAISDPAFRMILENYLNLSVPLSQNIVSNMFRFSIEDSLTLFETMNLFFLEFGVMPLQTAEGQISFYDTVLRQSTRGRITNRAQMLYRAKKDVYSYLKPGTVLGDILEYFSIQVPESFAGYEEQVALLPLPSSPGSKVTYLDMGIDQMTGPQRSSIIQIWRQIDMFQKIPAIFSYFLKGVSPDDMKNPEKMKQLFKQKMADPEIKALFGRLRISDTDQRLLTPEMFMKFVRQYPTFLQNALDQLNAEKVKESDPDKTLGDITDAKLDRATMARFADLFANEYSQFLTDLVYENVPLFKNYRSAFSHSYAFQSGPKVAYRNIIVSRRGPPTTGTYTAYSDIRDFKRGVLDSTFLAPKITVKKRGYVVDGKFTENKDSPEEHDVEVELTLPPNKAERLVRSFEMLTRMGYTIYYQESDKGIEGRGSRVSSAENIIEDFEAFFTEMVKSAIPRTQGAGPSPWKVRFLEESLYLSPSTQLFSSEMNVLQIGENTHFFYNFVKHAGIKNLIYPPGYGSIQTESKLMAAYRQGQLRGDYLDRFIELSSARIFTTASIEAVNSNEANELDALSREYDRLSLRNMEEIHMFDIFRGFLQENGDGTLLSGDNPSGLTMGQIIQNLMGSIGPSGMFPDHMIAIYGSPGGNSSGPVIGDLKIAEDEQSLLTIFSPTYKTPAEFYANNGNRLFFQRMLAYILHGWFSVGGSPSMYSANLVDSKNKKKKTSSDLALLGPNKDTASLDILGYRNKVAKSTPQGKRLSDLNEISDDFMIFLQFLYLVTDKDGKISVPDYERHIAELRARRGDKTKQMAYLKDQILLLEASGKKKSNFISCLLERNCYAYETPKEIFMSIGSHYLFQIDYYTNVLGVKNRIANGQGIQKHEIYDGASPYFNQRTFENPARFFFGYESFMGIDFAPLDDLFSGSSFESEYNTWKRNITLKKQTLILTMLGLEGQDELYQNQVNAILDILNEEPTGDLNWKEYLIQRLTANARLGNIFGSEETAPAKIERFVNDLESNYMLGKMLSNNELDSLHTMISGRMRQLSTEETAKIEDLDRRRTEIVTRYKDQREEYKAQMRRIEGLFNALLSAYTENKGVSDIPPILPIEAYRPTNRAAAPAEPGRRPEGTGAAMGEAEKPVQRPSAAVREGITVKSELARAERLANVQRLRTQLVQSQSLAQIEDLRLKLINAYLELFGGDSRYFAALSNANLAAFTPELAPFPKPVNIQPPEPQQVPEVNLPAFRRCALMSNRYDLRGAAEVSPRDVPEGSVDQATLEPYMQCRTRGVLVKGVKKVFDGLFDLTKAIAKMGATGTCVAVSAFISGVGGAIKYGGMCAASGPFGMAGCGFLGFLGSAAFGAATASTPCGYAASLSILYLLPEYVKRKMIGQSEFLQGLRDSLSDPNEKMRRYEEFFNSFERILNDPATTPEQVRALRTDLTNLFSLMLFESHYAENDPSKPAQPFTQILYGTGKLTHFNYYPFFKPSLEQVSFFQNLGVFDFTSIKKPEDLFTQLKGVRLTLDQPTLTVLFGEKYVSPPAGAPLQNPSYNIWYRIGEAIQSLDNYDKRKTPEGQPLPDGNLGRVLLGSSKLITDFFSGEEEEFDNLLRNAADQAAEEERMRAEEERAGVRRDPRLLNLSGFLQQAYALIENINLDDRQVESDVIKRRPLLIERRTFDGYLAASDVSPTGNSSQLEVRVILGDNDNSDWKHKPTPSSTDKIVVNDDDRSNFRDMFTSTGDFDTLVFYRPGWTRWSSDIPVYASKNPYSQLYESLDIPVESLQRARTFFSMYPDIPTGGWDFSFPKYKNHAWIPGETFYIDEEDGIAWDLKPEKNMHEYGNFPPFFFCDQANWAKKEILFGPTLQKFKYVQQTSTVDFPNGEIRPFYGWFLERDVATFAELQPPESTNYQRVSLMDAVLGKPFRIVGFDSTKTFTLFSEKGDTPQTKWFKAILLRTIFSTIPGSFKNVLEVGQHQDPFLGPLQTVTLYTRKRGVEIGAEGAFTFSGVVSPVANVRLVALEKERQKRKEEGKEDDTDIDEKTKTTRNTFIEQLERGGNAEILFKNIEESQREAAKTLLRGIFSYKLGKSFELRGENARYNESKRQIFRTDAPTLISIGRQNIQAARTALGDSFDAVYAALMNNLATIQTNPEVGTDLKEILAIAFELPLTGGGPANISNEKWNEFFEPDSLDEFPIIEISVKQKSVYYPDSLLHKYIAGRDT